MADIVGDPDSHGESVCESVGWPPKNCAAPCGPARIPVPVHRKDHAPVIDGGRRLCGACLHRRVVRRIRLSWFRLRGILTGLRELRIP